MTEKINITTQNICTERKKFQVPNQTFRVLTLNGVTTVAAYENGNFKFFSQTGMSLELPLPDFTLYNTLVYLDFHPFYLILPQFTLTFLRLPWFNPNLP